VKRLFITVAWLLLAATGARAQVPVLAAENFYGDIARQVGGADVRVTSVMSNPDQDPHLFEVSPSVGRAVSAARVVVYNGLDYDPWMEKLLVAARAGDRRVVVVGDLSGRKTGDNPHIWYDVETMQAAAKALADALIAVDPGHEAGYRQRLASFIASLQPVQAKIAALRQRLQGVPATATEPVFGYMFAALGMQVRNQSFQLAVMNNTEPSAGDVAAFENDLKKHQVRLLVYNSQATDPIAQRMERLAHAAGVPVLGVTETEPAGKTYQAWMLDTLQSLDRALPLHTS
jgi:zinc/manganese transport system substrate-binding protein